MPKTPTNQLRSNVIPVRFSDDELEQIDAVCGDDWYRSEFIRTKALAAAKRSL